MAQGDLTMFQEALAYMLDGGWETADTIKCALITNSPAVSTGLAEPGLGASASTTLTEVSAGGNYSAGGASVCTWGTMIVESAGTVTADDDSASVSWTKHASNPTTAIWAVVYNSSDGSKQRAICYIDLNGGSPVDMTAGDLTITWNASGIFQIS